MKQPTSHELDQYWSLSAADLLADLQSSPTGLKSDDAAERLQKHGPNELREQRRVTRATVLVNQPNSPLLLLLLFAAAASALTGEWVDASLVVIIVIASVGVGYSREFKAECVVEQLKARVRTQATVLRNGETTSIPVSQVVPGDVILLSAGSLVPADGIVLEAARHGARGTRGQRGARSPRARDASVFDRARGRPQPRAPFRNPEHQSGAWGPADGAPRCARATPERDREPGQHGRALHGQHRHANGGRGERRRSL